MSDNIYNPKTALDNILFEFKRKTDRMFNLTTVDEETKMLFKNYTKLMIDTMHEFSVVLYDTINKKFI